MYAEPCAEVVGRLRARYGVYAVLGNHDHWTDATLIADLFRAEGIRVLINEGTRMDLRGETFWLAGVDDTMVGLEDLRWLWPVQAKTNSSCCWLTIQSSCAEPHAPASTSCLAVIRTAAR